eukprot:scaffold22.g6062.t1
MVERGLPAQKLAVASLPGRGRALVAAQPIRAGEALLRVPPHLLLTPAAAAAGPGAAAAAAAAAGGALPDWTLLALWLAEARAAGGAHAWAPYLAALPEDPGSVLSWSDAQVAGLHGSHLHTLAAGIRAAAAATRREARAALAAAAAAAAAGGSAPPPPPPSDEQLDWALGILLTRLVRLGAGAAAPGGGGGSNEHGRSSGAALEVEALVPLADFANHDCAAACHLAWDAAAGGVVLRPDRGYAAGEEVVISYGERTSGELLLSYGFVPPPGANPHDACLLELAAVPSSGGGGASSSGGSSGTSSSAACGVGRGKSRRAGRRSLAERRGSAAAGAVVDLSPAGEGAAWKAAALERRGLPASRVFPLRLGAVPEELLRWAAFAAAPAGGAAEAEAAAGELLGGGRPLPARARHAAQQLLASRCRTALAGYPSSLEEDVRELARLKEERGKGEASGGGAESGSGGSARRGDAAAEAGAAVERRRRRQVLQVLVAEKRVLHRTVFLLHQELRAARHGGAG